jgi:triacylglycerol lipase
MNIKHTARLVALALSAGVAFAPPVHALTSYAKTKYPILLAHGMLGADQYGPLEYWYGIPRDLRDNGATVYVTSVSAMNTTELRGEQLLAQVEDIVAITGANKVNLIGHSHGGPTARYVAGVRPDLVASVSSVGGANKGSKFFDVVMGISPGPRQLLIGGFNALASLIARLSGHPDQPQDTFAGVESLSMGSAKFNANFPAGVPNTACGEGAHEVNGVRYYSWSGVGQFYNPLNPFDYIMKATSLVFQGEPNDGLISACGSHLGKVIRDNYPMNHFQEINQLMGLVGPGANPVSLFRIHANRLKTAGL